MAVAPALQRFIDDELGRMPDHATRVVAGTLASLREFRDAAQGGDRSDALELLSVLQRQGESFQRRFVESLCTRVADDVANGLPDASAGARSSFGGLALMDDARVDVDIAISHATQAIDAVADWELRELQTFTSALLGQDHVSAASNPFRPLLHASALWDAACTVTPVPAQRALLLRQSAAVSAQLLKRTWAAACSRLEDLGVQPCTYRTVVLPGAGSARAAAAPAAPVEGLGVLFAKVTATAPPGGSAGTIAAGASAASAAAPSASRFDELLRRLEEHLTHSATGVTGPPELAPAARLESHRPALVASAATPQDGCVIELLARLFETIFSDPALAPPFRQVIARLQVAALRVALSTPAVMTSNKHPVWLLVDRIGELSSAYRSPSDPGLLATQAFCEQLADELARAPAPDTELFRRALSRLEAWLHQQAQAALEAARPAIDALARAEERALVQAHWRQHLESMLARTAAPPSVQRFVTGVWARVVADAVLRSGAASDAVKTHLTTLDDLLWSVQLPDHPQSRQRLVSLLPSLLKRLQAGMAAIDLPAADQQTTLDELMQIHADALRPGARAAAAPGPSLAPKSTERRAAAPADAGRLQAADPVGGAGPRNTVPADMIAMPAAPGGAPAPAIDTLRPFERRRLFIQGRWSQCQLLWRSDHAQYFVFAGDAAGRTHSLTRGALDRMNVAGLLLPLQSKPLLQRAVDHLSRQPSLH